MCLIPVGTSKPKSCFDSPGRSQTLALAQLDRVSASDVETGLATPAGANLKAIDGGVFGADMTPTPIAKHITVTTGKTPTNNEGSDLQVMSLTIKIKIYMVDHKF